MPSGLMESLFILASLVALAYPAVYWSFVRVQPRTLFVFASYGLPVFLGLLFAGLFSPFQMFAIHMAPQLEAGGYLHGVGPLVSGGETLLEYSGLGLLALYLAAPPLIHRRYARPLGVKHAIEEKDKDA